MPYDRAEFPTVCFLRPSRSNQPAWVVGDSPRRPQQLPEQPLRHFLVASSRSRPAHGSKAAGGVAYPAKARLAALTLKVMQHWSHFMCLRSTAKLSARVGARKLQTTGG